MIKLPMPESDLQRKSEDRHADAPADTKDKRNSGDAI